MYRYLSVTVLCLLLTLECGGASGGKPDDSKGDVTPPPAEESIFKFSFQLSTDLDASNDAYDMSVAYPSTYTVPLHIRKNGLVTIKAPEFPKIVYRICAASVAVDGCNRTFDGDIQIGDSSFQEAVDIVIDSCGMGKDDSECGEGDTTTFNGVLSADGNVYVNAVNIRTRLFLVKDNIDGFRARPTDAGLFTLTRLVLRVTTDTVATGALTTTGTSLDAKALTLVGGGVVPSSIPELGGANYLVTLTGQFDLDPLAYLE